MAPRRPKVVVVGAGLSGLCVADRLDKARFDVTVLESSVRVGGRTASSATLLDPTVTIDIGGQWIGARQFEVQALAADLGVTLQPQYCSGRRVLQIGADVRTYSGLVPNMSWAQLVDAQLALLLVKLLQFVLWLLPSTSYVHRWACATTMEQLCRRCMWTAGGRALLCIVVKAFMGLDPAAVSVLALTRYVSANDDMERMTEIGPGSLQAWTCLGGAQQLSVGVAARVLRAGGRLLFRARVVAVERREVERAAPLLVRCEDGSSFDADHVVLALPPPLVQAAVVFSPPLSAGRRALLEQAAMGCIIKSIIVYPRAWWREAGYSGEVICDTASHPAGGPCFNLFDGCTPLPQAASPAAALPQALTAEATVGVPSAHYVAPEVRAWIDAGRPPASAPSVALVEAAAHPVTGRPQRCVPALVAFVNGSTASAWSSRDADERRRAVLAQIGAWFGDAAAAQAPLEYIEQDWGAYPHTRGCPVASYGAGVLQAFGLAAKLAQPEWPAAAAARASAGAAGWAVHRLHFAGTEAAEQHTGFLSGAIRSGHKAAAEVAADLAAEAAVGAFDIGDRLLPAGAAVAAGAGQDALARPLLLP